MKIAVYAGTSPYPGDRLQEAFRHLFLALLHQCDHLFYFIVEPPRYNSGISTANSVRKLVSADLETAPSAHRRVQESPGLNIEQLHPSIFWVETAYLYTAIEKLGIELLFCPLGHLAPRQLAIPSVVWLPEIFQESSPELIPRDELKLRHLMCRPSAEDASLVITSSESTARDLHNKYDLPEERCRVIQLGPRAQAAPRETPDDNGSLHALSPVLWDLSDLEAGSGHRMLLSALGMLVRSNGGKPRLILSGKETHPGEYAGIREFGISQGVEAGLDHYPGISLVPLPVRLESPLWAVHLSPADGLCLGVYDALEAGLPLLVCRETAAAEIAGDAAVQVDGRNCEELASQLRSLAAQPEKARTLSEKARQRKDQFGWSKSAANLLALFAELQKTYTPPANQPWFRRQQAQGG